jgi:hypothetical protein
MFPSAVTNSIIARTRFHIIYVPILSFKHAFFPYEQIKQVTAGRWRPLLLVQVHHVTAEERLLPGQETSLSRV